MAKIHMNMSIKRRPWCYPVLLIGYAAMRMGVSEEKAAEFIVKFGMKVEVC